MIDINELRRLAQAATPGPDGISLSWITLLQDFQQGVNPATVSELLDRLEAAEKAVTEAYQRGYATGQEEIGKERDALRAKIEAMERQVPVGYGVLYVEPATGEEDWDSIWKCREFAEDHIKDFTQAYADIGEPVGEITTVPVYALPGAKVE